MVISTIKKYEQWHKRAQIQLGTEIYSGPLLKRFLQRNLNSKKALNTDRVVIFTEPSTKLAGETLY